MKKLILSLLIFFSVISQAQIQIPQVVGLPSALNSKVDKVTGKSLVADTLSAKIQPHVSNLSNPHSVTKTQVGLGNVDNTSDANKPISDATQTALNNKVDKVTGSSLVPDAEILANRTAVKKVTTLTTDGGQLTGFVDPIAVNVSYNGATRKITLTGDIRAAYKGIPMTEIIPSFVSGWQSEAHDITDGGYFLYFNGTNFVWSAVAWDFKQLMIAFICRDGVNFCLRECHGLMDWQSHESNHNNIGTYLKSGADVAGFTLNSDVATNRRPTVSQALVYDEDLPSILPQLTNGLYSRLFLDGANNANLENDKTDIVEYTAGNRFTYNLFTGGVWTKATAANNQYAKVFLMAVPVTSDVECQKNRYIWIMPQTVNATLTTIQNLTPANLSLGQISTALAEYVFVQEFIIRATASGWTIISTAKLTGNKRFQSVTSGNFLSSVAHDTSITGDGTSGNPLGTTHAILPNKNEEADFQHLTAAQVAKVNNTSGTNTGDETLTSIKTKLGAATAFSDGYLKYQDWSIFNNKEPSFSKNSGFNKNFGTTTGTVLEGRTFGTAANSAVGDFIQNQNTSAQSANMWINGNVSNNTSRIIPTVYGSDGYIVFRNTTNTATRWTMYNYIQGGSTYGSFNIADGSGSDKFVIAEGGAATFASTVNATQLQSTVTGTAPLTVNSTTMVGNLNANYIGGIASDRIIYGQNASGSTHLSEDNLNDGLKSGFYTVQKVDNSKLPISSTDINILLRTAYIGPGNTGGFELLTNDSPYSELYFRPSVGGGGFGSWKTIYHNGNLTNTLSTNYIPKWNGSSFVNAVSGTDYQLPITLTTNGTSGAATLINGVMNVPNYGGGIGTAYTSTFTPITGLTSATFHNAKYTKVGSVYDASVSAHLVTNIGSGTCTFRFTLPSTPISSSNLHIWGVIYEQYHAYVVNFWLGSGTSNYQDINFTTSSASGTDFYAILNCKYE